MPNRVCGVIRPALRLRDGWSRRKSPRSLIEGAERFASPDPLEDFALRTTMGSINVFYAAHVPLPPTYPPEAFAVPATSEVPK